MIQSTLVHYTLHLPSDRNKQSDLIHYITGNGLRHASVPVHTKHPNRYINQFSIQPLFSIILHLHYKVVQGHLVRLEHKTGLVAPQMRLFKLILPLR